MRPLEQHCCVLGEPSKVQTKTNCTPGASLQRLLQRTQMRHQYPCTNRKSPAPCALPLFQQSSEAPLAPRRPLPETSPSTAEPRARRPPCPAAMCAAAAAAEPAPSVTSCRKRIRPAHSGHTHAQQAPARTTSQLSLGAAAAKPLTRGRPPGEALVGCTDPSAKGTRAVPYPDPGHSACGAAHARAPSSS